MSYSFFENKDCKFWPCHEIDNINCLFCFCPLYNLTCTGTFKIIDGKKDCSLCNFPHEKENYNKIINKINGV